MNATIKTTFGSLWLLLFSPTFLLGQFLVSDIEKAATGSTPLNFRVGNDKMIFTANSKDYGNELFITDGTEAGTKLLADLTTGNASTQFWDVAVIDTSCYFVTSVSATNLSVWRIGFVEQRPILLKNFTVNGISSSQQGKFTQVNNSVFFINRSANYLFELWKTDGSANGTTKVSDFTSNDFIDNMTALNGLLVFKTGFGLDKKLWRSDGTSNGTFILTNANKLLSVENEFKVFGNKIFFACDNSINGYELWETDGSQVGTKLFLDINGGVNSSMPMDYTVVGNTLFFTAADTINGTELWRTDGTTQGTGLVKDIVAGRKSGLPRFLIAHNNTLFFTVSDSLTGRELWKSDGTANGTQLVKDIVAGASSTFTFEFVAASNGTSLFFAANDSINGLELWKTDGTTQGTAFVKNIAANALSSFSNQLTAFKNQIFFSANDGITGQEVWKSDGTASGTTVLKQLNSTNGDASPFLLTPFKDKILFRARTAALGFELWQTDGTDNGTTLLKDIFQGQDNSNALLPRVSGDKIFFTANSRANYRSIWVSDGTSAGTRQVKDFLTPNGSVTNTIAILKNKAFFDASFNSTGSELWTSDGTEAGTVLVKDINPIGQSIPLFPPKAVVLKDSLLFFSAHNGINGVELWKTDGTTVGTSMVADIRQFDQNPNVYNYHITNMTQFGDIMLFSADDNASLGSELWRTDGTTAGTTLLKDIRQGQIGSNPNNLILFKGNIFFSANDGILGTELWKTDGTTIGTTLVKDITLSGQNGSIYNFVVHKNELFFVLSNPDNTQELWKTDGTTNGTIRVKKIGSTLPSIPQNLTSYGDFLYFSADDGINGQELWRSDGTEIGTKLLFDLYAGPASSHPSDLTPYKFDLYFSAKNEEFGRELWRLKAAPRVSIQEMSVVEIIVFPNPTSEFLMIQKGDLKQSCRVRLFDNTGKIVLGATDLVNETTALNVHNLPTGLYFLETTIMGQTKPLLKKILIAR